MTTERAPTFANTGVLTHHDLGCRCWPHVSVQDALDAVAAAGLAEYRDGLTRADTGELARLDVERLARALFYATLPPEYVATLPADYPVPSDLFDVERIAAEYAALAAQHTEEEPDWRKAHEEAGGDGHTGEEWVESYRDDPSLFPPAQHTEEAADA